MIIGTLELHEDTVEVVLSTAHHLLLTEVVDVCCDFLTKQLHPANCLGIQLFADTQGCSELHRIASTYTAVSWILECMDSLSYISLSYMFSKFWNVNLSVKRGNRLQIFLSFFQEHFQEVTQHQEFLQLPTEEAARLLASDDLNVPSEELIFQVNEKI